MKYRCKNHILSDCIYLAYDVTFDRYTCMIGHRWPCQTDSSICGDYHPENIFLTNLQGGITVEK